MRRSEQPPLTHVQRGVVGELAVVADGDVLLLPVLVERLLAALVEVALFDGDGAAAAQLGRLQAPLLLSRLSRRREQVRAAPVLPARRILSDTAVHRHTSSLRQRWQGMRG